MIFCLGSDGKGTALEVFLFRCYLGFFFFGVLNERVKGQQQFEFLDLSDWFSLVLSSHAMQFVISLLLSAELMPSGWLIMIRVSRLVLVYMSIDILAVWVC